jgi:Aldehyde oxidase and xanthine dehydrogenase, a/b hammerhead domain/CO dehydrogenase flavoprotein C-terminal domain
MKEGQESYYTEGIPVPETPAPGSPPRPWGRTKVIGTRLPRVDAYKRVSGSAIYPSDVLIPNMLYGAVLRCPHPHARVKRVDTQKAEQLPGVLAVMSGSSPEADLDWSYSREMPTKLFDPLCRFEGETVAAVAAETPYQASDALAAIHVEYEVLPFVVDERKALEPDEIVTEILLPPPQPGLKSSYRKVRARHAWDFALAGAALAMVVRDGKVEHARVVFSGVAPVPWRAREVETYLMGKPLTEETAAKAADIAVQKAEPMEQNGYKVPLLMAVVEEELMKYK